MIRLTQAPWGEFESRDILIPVDSIEDVTWDPCERVAWVAYGSRRKPVVESLEEIQRLIKEAKR